MSSNISNVEKFKELGLDEKTLRAISEMGFDQPSEIQEKTIPLVVQGKDVLGSSATGSGKTLAFGGGIFSKIERGKGVQALIMTPTRELAEQVSKNLKIFSKYHELHICEVYGGVDIKPQMRAITRSEIVVGTPGRILDHLHRRSLDLSKIKFLVLDEADRMLDMGFIHDVEEIIDECPDKRQTLLFSATISADIERISHKYMEDPVFVAVESYVDPSKLRQTYFDVPQNIKFSLLVHLLKKEHPGLVMIFCNTRMNTDFLERNLSKQGLHAFAIHGGLSQNKRNSIMQSFHSNEIFILICTDIAARGLDIKNVSHVYNYDIPKTSSEYIHRIGRTARAGKEGMAISLVSPRDYDNFRRVLEDHSIKIELMELPEVKEVGISMNRFHDRGDRRSSGRSGGYRGGGYRGGSRGGSYSRGSRSRGSSGGYRRR